VDTSDAAAIAILFQTLSPRWPSVRNLGLSFCAHVGLACVLGSLSFTSQVPARTVRRTPDGREIRVGDRLYYVARIAGPQAREWASAGRGTAAKKSGSRRRLVPPELKRTPAAKQTLIQPESAPTLPPIMPNLPSFEIWTMQLPKVARRFVVPGQRVTTPEVPKLIAPPGFELPPAPPNSQTARLTLPAVSAPVDSPSETQIAQLPAGDPVNIISLNNLATAPDNLLKVPPGNVVAEDQLGVDGSGSGKGLDPLSSGSGDTVTGKNNANGEDGTGSGGRAVAGSGKGLGALGTGAGGSGAGAGGRASGGTGSATAGGSSGGSVENGVGSRGVPVASAGKEGGPGDSGVKQTVILRPVDGKFDAVVVQSSPLDLFPEGRHLLSGRPIYTVYISVGTAKDWALYFCVAGEKTQNPGYAGVVQLTAAAPVSPPYPTRIIRPEVSLPKYEKFLVLHAVLSETGHFRDLRVVNPEVSEIDQAVLAAVGSWEFRPADRDGVPVATEILLVIPAAGL